jgi:ribosomal protein L31E
MTFWHSRFNSQINLSPEEMLEISQEISSEYAPSASDNTPEVVLLPVDPYHLYAYWNLVEKKANTAQQNYFEIGLTLRVYWHPDENSEIAATKLWFDVALQSIQHQCMVELPIDATAYSAAIGRRNADQGFDALAYSNTIHVPRGRIAPYSPKIDAAKTEAKPQRAVPSPGKTSQETINDRSYDEGLIDLLINETLYEKGAEKKFALPLNAEYEVSENDDAYDEVLIDAKINKTLYEKGFDENIAALLNPKEAIFDKPRLPSKNPSGQGNN